MMKLKRIKIIIIITIIAIALIFTGFIILYEEKDSTDINKVDYSKYSLEEIEGSNVCLTDQCGIYPYANYLLSYKTNIKEIDDIVDKINQDTKEYYDNYKTKEICNEKKGIYKYNNIMSTEYYIYANQDIINISIIRTDINLCTESQRIQPIESYIYDLKSNKIMSQEEFMTYLNISMEEISEKAEENMRDLYNLTSLEYSDISLKENEANSLYFDNDGNLYYFYYDHNLGVYDSALVKEA